MEERQPFSNINGNRQQPWPVRFLLLAISIAVIVEQLKQGAIWHMVVQQQRTVIIDDIANGTHQVLVVNVRKTLKLSEAAELVGMSEAEYTTLTYDTPLAFATTLARLNPNLVLVHISGASTDSSEQGRVMWARVKGRAENALSRLPLRAVYHFRPGLMKPVAGQKNLKRLYRVLSVFYPLLTLFFSALSLHEVGRAMIRCVQSGAPKSVLEVADIQALGTS